MSRDFVLVDKPRGIINIVDATNIERNLYLTMQLLEMNVPMVVALNMMDEMTGNGGSVDVNAMEAMLANFKSPQKPTVWFSKPPSSCLIVTKSVRVCVG